MFISPLLIKFIKKPEDLLTYKLSLKMGLINQQGMYQGAAPLNPLPYVNIALQQRARKQAREDAIDKYYTDLPNKINDKGVRDQEIPVINSLKTQMSDYYVKNKAAINNPNLDNGAARHGLDLLFRKTDATAAESKNRLKTDLQLGKWRFNKEKEYIFKNPNFIKIHEAHTLPIGTEGSQSIDIASLDVPPKPLDLNALRKDLKQFKYSEGTPTVTKHPTDKTLEVVTSNPIFKDEDKKSLYDYGATRLHSDPSFEEFIKNGLANTGLLPNLVEIAKKQFGVKDATEISDEDLSAAFLYSQLPTSQTKAKVIPSIGAKQDFAKDMQEDRQRHAEAMQLQGFKNALARQENAARLGLYKDKEGAVTPPNILNEFTLQYGEKYTEPITGQVMTIVDAKNIPNKYKGLLSTPPIKVGGRDIYVAMEDGSYVGNDKQVITPVSVADNYIKTYGNTKFKLEGRKKFLQAEQNQAPTQKQPPVPKKETPKSNKKQVPGWNN